MRSPGGAATWAWLTLAICVLVACHAAKPAALAPTNSAPTLPPLRCPEGMTLIPSGKTPGGWGPPETPSFCIDTLEATVSDYRGCVSAGACAKLDRTGVRWCNFASKQLRQAINCTAFEDAVAYCRFRGKRLPAPNEWGRAASGDTSRYHPWGNKLDVLKPGGVCWQQREPCEVGTRPQDVSVFGVRDLAGNVNEWTADPKKERLRPGEWHSEQILGGDWESTPDGPDAVLGSITSRPQGSIEGVRAGVRCAWPARGAGP